MPHFGPRSKQEPRPPSLSFITANYLTQSSNLIRLTYLGVGVRRRRAVKSELDEDIAAIRRFNRFYTERIALLNETLLDSPFTLAQARVLFELGTRKNLSAADLVDTLGLDPGYLSRILQDFKERRLVSSRRAEDDARRTKLSLTEKGRREFSTIDRRSRRSVAELIAPMSRDERRRVLGAMHTVEAHLSGASTGAAARSSVSSLLIRPHRIGDIGWAIERHGTLYAEEFGWNGEFEALVATLFARFATAHDEAFERCWIAEADGERLGCVFVVRNDRDASAAQLRCLLVDPKGRGLGIGRRLVEQCLTFAKSAGYAKMMLWTNDALAAARRIYEATGFVLVEESSHHSFGRDLKGQIWTKDL
jgi:DNA-binding MarR family transcriptional regulator/GNAT superfamily N-acetyltransferase